MIAFNIIRTQLFRVFGMLPQVIQGMSDRNKIDEGLTVASDSQSIHWSCGRLLMQCTWSSYSVPPPHWIATQTELLDVYAGKAEEVVVDSSAEHSNDIGFGKATFTWSNDVPDGAVTPSRQIFRLHIDDELKFKKDVFNLIIGPTGSGKTSILMALLGEMHYIPSGPESWKNGPW